MSWWSNIFGSEAPPPAPLQAPPTWLLPFLDGRAGQALVKMDVEVIVVSLEKDRVIFIKRSLAESIGRSLSRRGEDVTDSERVVLTAALAAAVQAGAIEQSEVQRHATSPTRYVAEVQAAPQWVFGQSPTPKTWSRRCHAVLLSMAPRVAKPADSLEILDFRSEEEKGLEQAARAGDVDSALERIVDDLLACSKQIADAKQRHIAFARIGEGLNASGGFSRMRLAAYRFSARGGSVSDLSQAWNGIGEWLD